MNFQSCRKIHPDNDLEDAKKYMCGLVLDIVGGMKRWQFKRTKKWNELLLDILTVKNTVFKFFCNKVFVAPQRK